MPERKIINVGQKSEVILALGVYVFVWNDFNYFMITKSNFCMVTFIAVFLFSELGITAVNH